MTSRRFSDAYEGISAAGLGPDIAAAMVDEAIGVCDDQYVSIYNLNSGKRLAFVFDFGRPERPPGTKEFQICDTPSPLHIARDRSVVWVTRSLVIDATGRKHTWGAIMLPRAPRYRETMLDIGFDLSADVRLNRQRSVVTWSKAGRTFSHRL